MKYALFIYLVVILEYLMAFTLHNEHYSDFILLAPVFQIEILHNK